MDETQPVTPDGTAPLNPIAAGDIAPEPGADQGQALGGTALVGDLNPKAPQVDGTNYVTDEAKAETMAYAGDDYRSKAANLREIDRKEEALQKSYKEIERNYDATTRDSAVPRRGLLRRKNLEARRAELDRSQFDLHQANAELQANRSKGHAADAQYGEDFMDFPEVMFERTGDLDENYDFVASEVEEWAGVLHDHPISDALREAHPDVEITPMSLTRMATELRGLKIEGRKSIGQTRDLSSIALKMLKGESIAYNTLLDSEYEVKNIKSMLERSSEARVEEWHKLKTNVLEAIMAIDDFHDELREEVTYEPRQVRIDELQKLLDDVRYGVDGHKPEENQSESEPQEQQSDN